VLVRSTPCDGGAITMQSGGGDTASAVQEQALTGGLLTDVPEKDLDLPCREGDADLWFAETPAELERAKALCVDCPIRIECLAGALSREEPWGVWGGEIFERGVVVPRKRPRGRPSKADLARDRAWAEAHERAQELARALRDQGSAARSCA
jgi:WhiB family transcriptional regulator, redox-sensing transcriptional regulator